MAGFRRDAKSLAGRKIKPTSRVRAMLSESLFTAFDQAMRELEIYEQKLRSLMAEKQDEQPLQEVVSQMRRGENDLHEVLDELREYIPSEDFEAYRQQVFDMCACCDQVEREVCVYVSVQKEQPSLDEKQKKLRSVLAEARTLEQEFRSIEAQLTRSFHITPPSAPPLPDSSTPKTFNDAGATAPRAPMVVPSASAIPIQDTTPVVTPVADATAQALQRLATVLEGKKESGETPHGGRLPRVEPDIFRGDLITFPAWWNAFETMIEGRAKTEAEKLYYLSKYTAGPAHECIKGFLSLYTDETSYRKARNVVVGRFGNRLKIAEAFKDKLNRWAVMKEGDGLAVQQFADFLWQCHSALDSLEYLTNLNCQEENRRMACKLPKAMCERWDREVDMAVFGEDEQDFTEEPGALTGRFPTFTEFCKFVGKEARIMVSSCRTSTATPAATAPKKNKATTLVSTPKEKAPADSGPKQCGHCGGNHYVYQCKDFLGKNVEYKKDYAIARGLCFGCLRSSHMYRSCRIRNPEIMRDHVQPGDERPPRAAALHIDIDSSGAHSTMIVPVWCYHQENAEFRVLVYALLDSQSSGCFLSEELADRLQMEPDQVTVDLTTLGSRRMVKCGAVQGLRVKSASRETLSIGLPKCYTRKCIPGNYEYIPQPAMVEQWPHLREVSRLLPEPDREIHFGLLLGFNCSEALNVEEYRRGARHHPFGALTALGWTVTGCLTHSTAEQQRRWSFGTEVKEVNSEDIRRVFDSEFMSGDSEHRKVSQDDALFDRIMRDGLSLGKDGHFQVPLPFRSAPQNLPDSRPMALRRLMSSKRKMKRDGMFGAQYAEFMHSVISSGQATLVVKPDQVPVGQRWYWCTHAVTHPRKPGKVRGVWDGAAEVQGESINHHLLTGPDQMNNLVGVLAKFRREKVAVTCDIEGMFLQVRIEPSHRRYLRFLWFKDGDPDGDVLEYEMTVLPFGAASSPACAGRVLQETADRFANEFGEQAASFLKDQFYVDDGLGSVPDDAEALALIHNSRGMCAAGGFNLRKFACSSKAVMEAIPEAWRVASLTDLCIRQSHLPNERVLGMLMSLEKDAFLYCVQMLVKGDSRRCYLSALSSLFDPMGLVSPALLPGRLLLQRLCSNKFDWDDPVGDSVQAQWQEWYQQLTDLNGLEIPRCFRRTAQLPLLRRELHVFCDASDYGYGACCYILLTDEQGRCDTSLVYAKSRVAPSKATTIPRLELQAAVLGVKMGLFIAEELQYPGLTSYYWSDSTVVLGYITNESKRFHVYVANRSQFIRSRTSASQWHHVPTEQNPADVASRGATCEQLMYSTLWWHGPAELMLTVAECELKAELTEDDPEIRRNVQSMASDLHGEPPSPAEELLERYSSWRKCLSVAARCLQFVDRLRRKARRASGPEAPISVFKQRAQNWIVRAVQARAFVDELTVLGRQEPDADAAARKAALRPSSNLYRLDVYLDNTGLLRVGGRLRLAGWPRDMVHPVVVPAAGPLARRIVEFFHESCQHMGVVTTMNSIRQAGIWLIGGKSAVSGIVSTCTVCRRKRGAPVQQKMADLPADRLATEAPFTYVAADLFGPMSVKRGRTIEKWWVCVFVCMASRAVHLEPVASLDVSGFMQAYRRFVARRGPVRSLRCDRGTNFVGASNEQAAALRELPQEQLRDELGRRACDLVPFVFNYPKASNMAGSWERMIRTVRSAFWVTLRKFGESLYLDVFQTMIAEAEGLVNSRPLTTVDMSDDTTPCAITPAQLLTMKSHVLAPPPGQFDSEDRYAKKRWRLTQYLSAQFWRRWVKEYALMQQQRPKWQKERDNLRVGDIVIVHDESAPRGRWPLARIAAVSPSDDGLVRKVTVRTATTELDRPVNKVVLLCRPGDQ